MSDRNFWRNWFPSPKKLQRRIDALTAELALCQHRFARLEAHFAAQAEAHSQGFARLQADSAAKAEAAEHRFARLDAEVLAKTEVAEQRIARVELGLKRMQPDHSPEADSFYAAFEARFRGSQSAIMERQSYYLPHIAQARARVAAVPPSELPPLHGPHAVCFGQLRSGQGVLDLGSGRGEWLELLRREGIPATGVELNQVFLEQCQKAGLQVIASDVIECLKAAPSESVSVVTGFHIIEHLPFPVLQEFVRESFRILRRGGIAIFETPNPRNIQVGAHNFWSDPTHLRPAHPHFTQFLLEDSGFSPVHLESLSPYPTDFHVGQPDDPLAQRFNEFFYGPQDFAVIGTKN